MVSGTAVAVTAGGAVLLYSAVKNVTISETLHSFLAGNPVTVPGGGVIGGVPTDPNNGNAPPTGKGYGSNQQAFQLYCRETLGFTKAGTAGAMGNVERESGFSTSVFGDGGTSGGMCQWHAGRFSALQTYARARNLDWKDVRAQLGFMQVELNSGYADVRLRMMGATNPEAAAFYWGKRFEGCKECYSTSTSEMQARMAAARAFYNQM